jgi:hypothetical protein
VANLTISSEPNAVANDVRIVEEGLHRFNFEMTRIPYEPLPVILFLRSESGEIHGGLIGRALAAGKSGKELEKTCTPKYANNSFAQARFVADQPCRSAASRIACLHVLGGQSVFPTGLWSVPVDCETGQVVVASLGELLEEQTLQRWVKARPHMRGEHEGSIMEDADQKRVETSGTRHVAADNELLSLVEM